MICITDKISAVILHYISEPRTAFETNIYKARTPRVSSMDNTNCRRFRSQFSDLQTPTNLAILVKLCEKIHNMKLLQYFLQYTCTTQDITEQPNSKPRKIIRTKNSSKRFKGKYHRLVDRCSGQLYWDHLYQLMTQTHVNDTQPLMLNHRANFTDSLTAIFIGPRAGLHCTNGGNL